MAKGSSLEHWRAAAEASGLVYQAQPVASIAEGLARVRAGASGSAGELPEHHAAAPAAGAFHGAGVRDGLALVGREGTDRDLLAIILPILASTAVVSLLLLLALSGLTSLAVWFVEQGFHHSDVNANDGR